MYVMQGGGGFGGGLTFGAAAPAPAPAFGGFGGFGAAAPAPAPAFGAAPAFGGFGQQQQQAAPAFGAAPGSFGAAPAPASGGFTLNFGQAAGGAGAFGAPKPAATGFGSPSTAGGFGGFGAAPAPAPAAGGLFGGFGAPAQQQQPAAGGFGGFGAGATSAFGAPAGGAGFGQTAGAFGQQPAASASPFGAGFGAQTAAPGGITGTTIARFQETRDAEATGNGPAVAYMTITAMNAYLAGGKSLEELRWEDKQLGRGQGGPNLPGAPPAQQQQTGFGAGFGAPVQQQPAFGGFGGASAFGAAPAAAPAFGGFGAAAAAPAPAFGGGFGGFGAAAPAPAPAFGGFGAAPAPAPAPGLGGFSFASAPAPAPAFGGFGAPAPAPAPGGFSLNLGGFGAAPAPAPGGFSFAAPAPAPAPAAGGFGGFGGFGAAPAPAPAAAAPSFSFNLGGFGAAPAPAPAPAFGGFGSFGGFGAAAPAALPGFAQAAVQQQQPALPPPPAMGAGVDVTGAERLRTQLDAAVAGLVSTEDIQRAYASAGAIGAQILLEAREREAKDAAEKRKTDAEKAAESAEAAVPEYIVPSSRPQTGGMAGTGSSRGAGQPGGAGYGSRMRTSRPVSNFFSPVKALGSGGNYAGLAGAAGGRRPGVLGGGGVGAGQLRVGLLADGGTITATGGVAGGNGLLLGPGLAGMARTLGSTASNGSASDQYQQQQPLIASRLRGLPAAGGGTSLGASASALSGTSSSSMLMPNQALAFSGLGGGGGALQQQRRSDVSRVLEANSREISLLKDALSSPVLVTPGSAGEHRGRQLPSIKLHSYLADRFAHSLSAQQAPALPSDAAGAGLIRVKCEPDVDAEVKYLAELESARIITSAAPGSAWSPASASALPPTIDDCLATDSSNSGSSSGSLRLVLAALSAVKHVWVTIDAQSCGARDLKMAMLSERRAVAMRMVSEVRQRQAELGMLQAPATGTAGAAANSNNDATLANILGSSGGTGSSSAGQAGASPNRGTSVDNNQVALVLSRDESCLNALCPLHLDPATDILHPANFFFLVANKPRQGVIPEVAGPGDADEDVDAASGQRAGGVSLSAAGLIDGSEVAAYLYSPSDADYYNNEDGGEGGAAGGADADVDADLAGSSSDVNELSYYESERRRRPSELPILPSSVDGYYTIPSPRVLAGMTRAQLQRVAGFMVGREGYGEIQWSVPVDLTPQTSSSPGAVVDLGRVVQIDDGVVHVYHPSTTPASAKPRPGAGLNHPATISLLGAVPDDGEGRVEYEERLRGHCDGVDGMAFVSYDAATTVWTFTVAHFSTYGIPKSLKKQAHHHQQSNAGNGSSGNTPSFGSGHYAASAAVGGGGFGGLDFRAGDEAAAATTGAQRSQQWALNNNNSTSSNAITTDAATVNAVESTAPGSRSNAGSSSSTHGSSNNTLAAKCGVGSGSGTARLLSHRPPPAAPGHASTSSSPTVPAPAASAAASTTVPAASTAPFGTSSSAMGWGGISAIAPLAPAHQQQPHDNDIAAAPSHDDVGMDAPAGAGASARVRTSTAAHHHHHQLQQHGEQQPSFASIGRIGLPSRRGRSVSMQRGADRGSAAAAPPAAGTDGAAPGVLASLHPYELAAAQSMSVQEFTQFRAKRTAVASSQPLPAPMFARAATSTADDGGNGSGTGDQLMATSPTPGPQQVGSASTADVGAGPSLRLLSQWDALMSKQPKTLQQAPAGTVSAPSLDAVPLGARSSSSAAAAPAAGQQAWYPIAPQPPSSGIKQSASACIDPSSNNGRPGWKPWPSPGNGSPSVDPVFYNRAFRASFGQMQLSSANGSSGAGGMVVIAHRALPIASSSPVLPLGDGTATALKYAATLASAAAVPGPKAQFYSRHGVTIDHVSAAASPSASPSTQQLVTFLRLLHTRCARLTVTVDPSAAGGVKAVPTTHSQSRQQQQQQQRSDGSGSSNGGITVFANPTGTALHQLLGDYERLAASAAGANGNLQAASSLLQQHHQMQHEARLWSLARALWSKDASSAPVAAADDASLRSTVARMLADPHLQQCIDDAQASASGGGGASRRQHQLQQLALRQSLSAWLETTLSSMAAQQRGGSSSTTTTISTGDVDGVYTAILSSLARHDLSSAVDAALQANHPMLAVLLSQAGTEHNGREFLSSQLEQWNATGGGVRNNGKLMAIYALLAGQPSHPLVVQHCPEQHWLAWLGLHLWYGAEQQDGLDVALRSYEQAVEAGAAPVPAPWYFNDGHGNSNAGSSAAFSVGGARFMTLAGEAAMYATRLGMAPPSPQSQHSIDAVTLPSTSLSQAQAWAAASAHVTVTSLPRGGLVQPSGGVVVHPARDGVWSLLKLASAAAALHDGGAHHHHLNQLLRSAVDHASHASWPLDASTPYHLVTVLSSLLSPAHKAAAAAEAAAARSRLEGRVAAALASLGADPGMAPMLVLILMPHQQHEGEGGSVHAPGSESAGGLQAQVAVLTRLVTDHAAQLVDGGAWQWAVFLYQHAAGTLAQLLPKVSSHPLPEADAALLGTTIRGYLSAGQALLSTRVPAMADLMTQGEAFTAMHAPVLHSQLLAGQAVAVCPSRSVSLPLIDPSATSSTTAGTSTNSTNHNSNARGGGGGGASGVSFLESASWLIRECGVPSLWPAHAIAVAAVAQSCVEVALPSLLHLVNLPASPSSHPFDVLALTGRHLKQRGYRVRAWASRALQTQLERRVVPEMLLPHITAAARAAGAAGSAGAVGMEVEDEGGASVAAVRNPRIEVVGGLFTGAAIAQPASTSSAVLVPTSFGGALRCVWDGNQLWEALRTMDEWVAGAYAPSPAAAAAPMLASGDWSRHGAVVLHGYFALDQNRQVRLGGPLLGHRLSPPSPDIVSPYAEEWAREVASEDAAAADGGHDRRVNGRSASPRSGDGAGRAADATAWPLDRLGRRRLRSWLLSLADLHRAGQQ